MDSFYEFVLQICNMNLLHEYAELAIRNKDAVR